MKNFYILMIAVILLAGCALSPQTVNINPALDIKSSSAATKPTIVELTVVDSRGTQVLGQRGGIYEETSDISTDANMTASLARNLATALNTLGYQVARQGEAGDAVLTVKINKLTYSVGQEKLLYKVETRAEVQAVCRKGTREFTGGYSATRKKDFVKVPSMDENETIVNEALAVALQTMLKDTDLIAFVDQ